MTHPVPLPQEFGYRLVMQSDWHIGSGAGIPGYTDRLVARDHENLPYVPAKSVTGVWRDACELVAAGLDGQTDGVWHRWVEFLFGSQPGLAGGSASGSPPLPARLSLRPARLPQRLREVLRDNHVMKAALTYRKPGVAIGEHGVAEEDKFRVEELVRGGVALDGEADLALDQLDDRQRLAATFILLAGARMVQHIGGKRRRGYGRCALTILAGNGLELDPYVTWVESLEDVPEPPAAGQEEPGPMPAIALMAATAPQEKTRSAPGWVRIRLRIRAQLPILAAARTLGNVVESWDWIPGTYLLPIVTRTLHKLGVDAQPYIAAGELLALPATPEIAGQRGVPIPRCLFHEKEGGGFATGRGVYNRFRDAEGDKQLKQYRNGFIAPEPRDGWYETGTTRKSLHTHNIVDDDQQRPNRETGGVYSYEAIAAGCVLRSEIRLSAALHESLIRLDSEWWRRLEGCHQLGRSKKDDYGLVSLECDGPLIGAMEPAAIGATDAAAAELSVWLVSPALLRSERLGGACLVEDLRKELERLLCVDLEPRGVAADMPSAADKDLLHSVLHPFRLDSWHGRWNLPRPTLLGLDAGSCAVFRIKSGRLDPERLAEVQLSGIGERRAEGFGQVLFNHPLLTKSLKDSAAARHAAGRDANPDKQTQSPLRPDEDPLLYDYCRIIEREAWREWIRRRALESAFTKEGTKRLLGITPQRPPLSQLGALRAQVRRLQSFPDARLVIDWLQRIKNKENRRDRWPEGALEADSPLIKLFHNKEEVWSLLRDDSATSPLKQTLTVDGERVLKEELWAEAVQAVVEACLMLIRHTSTESGADSLGGEAVGTPA